MKTSTLAAMLFSGALLLSSCGEHNHDNGTDTETTISPEETKEAQKAVDAIQESINEIEDVESQLDQALEDLEQ